MKFCQNILFYSVKKNSTKGPLEKVNKHADMTLIFNFISIFFLFSILFRLLPLIVLFLIQSPTSFHPFSLLNESSITLHSSHSSYFVLSLLYPSLLYSSLRFSILLFSSILCLPCLPRLTAGRICTEHAVNDAEQYRGLHPSSYDWQCAGTWRDIICCDMTWCKMTWCDMT